MHKTKINFITKNTYKLLQDIEKSVSNIIIIIEKLMQFTSIKIDIWKSPMKWNSKNSKKFVFNKINNIIKIYLSTSPKTMSWVPIIVTTSAIICPLDIWFKACKWPKPGAFILHLKGLSVLLEIR